MEWQRSCLKCYRTWRLDIPEKGEDLGLGQSHNGEFSQAPVCVIGRQDFVVCHASVGFAWSQCVRVSPNISLLKCLYRVHIGAENNTPTSNTLQNFVFLLFRCTDIYFLYTIWTNCAFKGSVSPDKICLETVWLNRPWLGHEAVVYLY